jgi:hypothetical protein
MRSLLLLCVALSWLNVAASAMYLLLNTDDIDDGKLSGVDFNF